MTSPQQVLANQENTQKSASAKTEEEKKKSSLNVVHHDLNGQTIIMRAEDMKAYLAFRKDLEAQLQPADALESQMARRMIDLQWRLNRCFALEMAVYALGHSESPGNVACSDSQIHAVMTAARVLRDQNSSVRVLGMHEQRLTRMYNRAKAELKSLQAARKAEESNQLSDAALIRKYERERAD
jgi:hypothetical protein